MDSNCTMNYNTGSEQGDSSSAEEVESPRSVVTAASARKSGRLRRWRKIYAIDRHLKINELKNKEEKEKSHLHNQVLRIKEEELQIGEYLMDYFAIFNINYVIDDDDVWSRNSNLPASPLGSNKNY